MTKTQIVGDRSLDAGDLACGSGSVEGHHFTAKRVGARAKQKKMETTGSVAGTIASLTERHSPAAATCRWTRRTSFESPRGANTCNTPPAFNMDSFYSGLCEIDHPPPSQPGHLIWSITGSLQRIREHVALHSRGGADIFRLQWETHRAATVLRTWFYSGLRFRDSLDAAGLLSSNSALLYCWLAQLRYAFQTRPHSET